MSPITGIYYTLLHCINNVYILLENKVYYISDLMCTGGFLPVFVAFSWWWLSWCEFATAIRTSLDQ